MLQAQGPSAGGGEPSLGRGTSGNTVTSKGVLMSGGFFLSPSSSQRARPQALTGNKIVQCLASPSPHQRGSLSPPRREGLALGKQNKSSENFPVGFCCWFVGEKNNLRVRSVMWGVALPCRQTRGAAGGRRDRLQELHQENPVGTSRHRGIPPTAGLGRGGPPRPLAQHPAWLVGCGTPSLRRRQGAGSVGKPAAAKGQALPVPASPAHAPRGSCAPFHPKICPFVACAWLLRATR